MSNQIFPYTNHSRFTDPEIFVSGNNDIVYNKDGKQYFDCNSGLWNVNFGYDNPSYANSFNTDIHFYPTHFWSSTEVTELAAKTICEHFGYNRVFFGHSGSDAITSAAYITRYHNSKPNILAYSEAYHGSTDIACVFDSYIDLINAIDDNTSAVLIEPLMVAKGIIEFNLDVMNSIFELKKKYNFNIIFDETVTGFGRADYSFTWNPDILIVSKGLTNGIVPLSAVLVSADISKYIETTDRVFSHGHTMSGYPIASNVFLKTYELMKNTNINKTEFDFSNYLNYYKLNYTSKGLIFGIKVNDGIYVRRALQKEGYLIRQHNDVLLFVPMFTADSKNYIKFFEKVATF